MLLVRGPGFDGAALPAMPVTGFDELFAAGPATAPTTPAPPSCRSSTPEARRVAQGRASLSQRAITSAMTQIAAGPHGGRPGERALVVALLLVAGGSGVAGPRATGSGCWSVIAESTEPAELVRALDELRIGYAALVPAGLSADWSSTLRAPRAARTRRCA